MLDMIALIQHCAPTVDSGTMSALVKVESSNHPYAIGVVGGRLIRQPVSHAEAVATAHQLDKDGWNFSVGLGQINRHYLSKHKITYNQAFKPCTNLYHSSKILKDCYLRAQKCVAKPQAALRAALSCYYSGNFQRGFKPDHQNKPSYVQKVVAHANATVKPIPVVPAIQTDSYTNSSSKPDTNLKDLNKNSNINDSASIQPTKNPIDHTSVLVPVSKTKNDTNDNIVQRYPLLTDSDKKAAPQKDKAEVNQPNSTLVF